MAPAPQLPVVAITRSQHARCSGATDGASGATDGTTGTTDGASGATDGASGATDGTTGATDGASGATDGTTGATAAYAPRKHQRYYSILHYEFLIHIHIYDNVICIYFLIIERFELRGKPSYAYCLAAPSHYDYRIIFQI